uniref:(northern house mosquito) hypothetical protein n=1 Tax=Culex pipiens TaxID=7175 RepID=A0A8D8H0P7_CULPI
MHALLLRRQMVLNQDELVHRFDVQVAGCDGPLESPHSLDELVLVTNPPELHQHCVCLPVLLEDQRTNLFHVLRHVSPDHLADLVKDFLVVFRTLQLEALDQHLLLQPLLLQVLDLLPQESIFHGDLGHSVRQFEQLPQQIPIQLLQFVELG